jgi:adenylate cyclase
VRWQYGPALALAALCCQRLLFDDHSADPETHRLKGADFARRSLEVASEEIGTMMALVDRALALNPNYARGWHISGVLNLWAGRLDIAIERLEAALRLSPRARVGQAFALIGRAHFFARRFDEAVPKLLLAIQEDPSFPQPYRTLAACYAHMGRLDEARATVDRLRAVAPVVIPDASFMRTAEHREFYLSGLRLAAGTIDR